MAKTNKKRYEKWILHVSRTKGQNAVFEKLERYFDITYPNPSVSGVKPEPIRTIAPAIMLTQDEVDEFNKVSAQTGIGYFLPVETKEEETVEQVDYNEEGFDSEGYNKAGIYNAKYDRNEKK
jgi:hypothetical protein